ncbi:MAG TPA: PAS domain S-box protein [Patescibacteria group bacterium]|nr:PAS domain S-box protein [Patescibacteria group bacterium]
MHNLLTHQLRRATRPDGSLDLDRLFGLVGSAYEESDRERRLNDRCVNLLQAELEAANTLIQDDAEAQVNAIMDNVGEAVILMGPDRIIRTVNDAALRIFAYDRAELIGANVAILMDSLDAAHHDQTVSTYLNGGQAGIIGKGRQVYAKRKTGDVFPIELAVGEMMLRKQGRMFIGIVRDITARKHAEDALKANEKRFRDLAASASDWFWETDANHRYVYISSHVRDRLGIAPEALIGRDRSVYWNNATAPELWETHCQDLAARRPFRDFVFNIQIEAGAPVQTVRSSGIPIFDDDGLFLGYRGTARNITREVAAEQRAVQAEHQFLDAIETISDGFALYDKDDRLIVCNEQYREIFTLDHHDAIIGETFIDIIHDAAARGIYGYHGRELEQFLTDRIAEHRNPTGKALVQALQSGHWIVSKEYRTRDGGVVGIRTDITELKKREEQVERLSQRYELILQSAGDGIIGVDASNIVTFANPAACRMLVSSRRQLEGSDYRQAFCGSEDYCPLPSLADASGSGEAAEGLFLRTDGARFTGEYVLAPIHEDHVFKGAVLVFRDVSLRKQYEESIANHQLDLERQVTERTLTLSAEVKRRAITEDALIKSQGRLKAITSSLFEGVLLVDALGHILFANPSAHRLLLASAEQLPGTELDASLRTLRQGKPVGFAQSPFPTVIESGNTVIEDEAVFIITRTGKRLGVAYASAPLEEEGKRRAAIISFRSIEALQEAQRDSLQSSRLASVGQLAAGIAHEINTPIQYVGDNLRFIQDAFVSLDKAVKGVESQMDGGSIPPATIDSLRALFEDCDLAYLLGELPIATSQSLEGVARVSHIVRSMKEFSHPGSTAKVATDINRAINSTVIVSTNEWKQVARLETKLDPDLPPILCFAADVNQVLLNLIVNASHAIESAGVPPLGTITVSTRRDGDFVEIRVADTGPGVPFGIRDKIFDPFFTTKEVGKGTGQGLAISFDVIVNKHGGKIYLDDNATDGGATFVVRLPIGEKPD